MKSSPPRSRPANCSEEERQRCESSIRSLFDAGDLRGAATATIELYGPEVLRFLRVRLRESDHADEAFCRFCEQMWTSLPDFRWRSTLRTWLFALARHTASRQANVSKRISKHEGLRDSKAFDEACDRVRTETATFQRTETKHRVRELRDRLDEDQQTLLVLRVERGLSWRELAVVMGEVSDDASEPELTRASARVRTRFQVAKRRLRELAIEAGLLSRTKG
jgi:RNA polymerase sigma-70 factor (ECF subfamily)